MTASTSDASSTTSTRPAVVPAGADAASSCVSEYSVDALRERPFAFDGTVVELRTERDPRAPTDDEGGDVVTTRAVFDVHEWFVGGSEPSALVWMMREVAIGDRLLVTGAPRWGGDPLDDAIAWECGFTAAHSDALADEWRGALAG
jgi:hypothetical protein